MSWLDWFKPIGYVRTTALITDSVDEETLRSMEMDYLALHSKELRLSNPDDRQAFILGYEAAGGKPVYLEYLDEYIWTKPSIPSAITKATIDKIQKPQCLYCTTPYEDESGSCAKCGAPRE